MFLKSKAFGHIWRIYGLKYILRLVNLNILMKPRAASQVAWYEEWSQYPHFSPFLPGNLRTHSEKLLHAIMFTEGPLSGWDSVTLSFARFYRPQKPNVKIKLIFTLLVNELIFTLLVNES